MKQNFSFIYKAMLMIGDGFSLVLGFTLAYILRVSLDPRPIALPVKAYTYITLVVVLLPIWLAVFYLLGLYNKRIYTLRPKEVSRLFIGALSGVLLLVTFDFFSDETLFPAKLVPIYAVLMCFIVLWSVRTILRWIRFFMSSRGYGVVKVLLVGNNNATYYLAKYLHDNPYSGYQVVGVVANKQYVFEESSNLQYRSVATAIEATEAHAIIQTDSKELTSVYNLAIENHLDYQFIPTHEALFTAKHSIDLLGAFPLINVYTTPLIGWGRVVKRISDFILSLLGLILTLPLWLVIAMIIKLSDPKSKVFYKQPRFTRFKKLVNIYKFRTHVSKYNGLSPEEAFVKMGKPELIKQYRENGDVLKNDPRVSRFGRFLRKFSLDELPQLVNILKGDISLVGPRALVKEELDSYEFKSLILSVKSGLTGLAQISGRKDISFEERRKLDMYYVQNWSIWLDIQIILRTFYMVITARGQNE
jgi:exopolysaccharide biosynthesis polyprenyl glycosylphosphotransferase